MISVERVSKSYGEKQVLNNFSCSFDKGFSFVTGASGCGKTTLLRLILELDKADSGEIIVDEHNFSVVFQENRLFENMSVKDNIHYVTDKAVDFELVKSLGLGEYVDKRVDSLSGGTKRRVALLRALSVPFDVLILDEPFTGLDDKVKKEVVDCLIRNCYNKIVIISTHDKEAIAYFGDDKRVIEVK